MSSRLELPPTDQEPPTRPSIGLSLARLAMLLAPDADAVDDPERMFRVVGLALLVGIAASIVSGGNSTVVLIAMVGTVALFVWALVSGRTALRCPNCGKRVKLGYSTCHHCGAQVATPRSIGAPKIDPMAVLRECEHCKSAIRPDASVCPHCQREGQAWTLKDGRWWRFHDESQTWFWYDPERVTWNPASG